MAFWFGKKKKEKEAAELAERERLALEEANAVKVAQEQAAVEQALEDAAKEQAAQAEAAEAQAVQAQAAKDLAAREQAAHEAALQEREAAARVAAEQAAQAREAQDVADKERAAQELADKAAMLAAPVIQPAVEPIVPPVADPEPSYTTDPVPPPAPAPDPSPAEIGDAQTVEQAAEAETKAPGFFSKLATGLKRSSSKLSGGITGVFTKRKLDDDTLEELEDLLIMSDLGTAVARRVTKNIAKDRFEKEITDEEIKTALADEITQIMAPREQIVDFADGPSPRVVLFVGVNGSGKTTTIGKIASRLQAQGAKAMLVAADTFRAAAIEQLTVWGERAGIPVISKALGADAAGLVYEAVEKAKAENYDLVLIDTAGRLQNKSELMSELAKIVRVVQKLDPDAPHDVILVLDATVGQNALSQVEAFRHTAGVTGLVMTKLDGTAKGGVLVAVAEAHELPIHFVGVGESAEDLQPFSAAAYAKALVGLDRF